jgi:DNA invertase Pin-like site-specific DNA recombinase
MTNANVTLPDIPRGSTWLTYLRDSGNEKQTASCDQQARVVSELLATAGASLARPPYRDEARSGSSTVGRHALDQLMADAAPGVADGVIFWSSARMAREINDAQIIRATLRKRGYRLVYIADQVPNIGVWTPLLEVVQDIRNAQYLEQLSQEVKRGHNSLLRLGYVPSGKHPPPGYRIVREQYSTHRDGTPMLGIRWVKDPETRARVEKAWEMRLAGFSYRAIHRAVRLYVNGGIYGRFFRNPIYKGTFVWGGQVYEEFCEPYVTAAQWAQVQALAKERRGVHPRNLGNRHLLVGLLRCPVCQGRVSTHHIRRANYHHLYYVCAKKLSLWESCPQRLVRADHLEERVVEKVMAVYYNPAELRRVYDAWRAERSDNGAEAERAQLQAAIERGEREIANLLKLAKLGQFESVAAELSALEAAQAERRQLAQALAASIVHEELLPLDDLPALAAQLQAALTTGDGETARLLLSKLVARIDINQDGSPHLTLRRPTRRSG